MPARTVHVAGLSAREGLVADGAVLSTVASDDLLAISACPVHGYTQHGLDTLSGVVLMGF